MEQYAVLAYRHDVPGDSVQGNNLASRAQLFDKLYERDILPLVSQQAEAAIELNGHMPYLLGYDKHPTIASDLRNCLANQIKATASARPVVEL